jgi:hypothetical protein
MSAPSWLAVLALASCLSAHPLGAQTAEPESAPANSTEAPELGTVYAYGAAGGLVGFFTGGLAGLAFSHDCTGDDYCGLRGFLIGAAVGGTLSMAVGVHLGNDRRGSLPLDMLTGAAVWGVGIGTAAATGWDDSVTLIAAIGVPIAQLLATTAVERATGRSRDAKRSMTLYGGPGLRGGAVFGASLTF